MSSYQNIEDPNAGATTEKIAYDSDLPPSNYQYDETYGQQSHTSVDNEDSAMNGAELVLRGVEAFFLLICFSVMASIKHYSELDLAENQVVIAVFAFLWVFTAVVGHFAKFQSRYLPNWDIWVFTFDFLFTVLLFCSSIAIGAKCNKKIEGTDMKICEMNDFKNATEKSSKNFAKAHASVAFGFLASFLFVASTFMSYKKVAARRA